MAALVPRKISDDIEERAGSDRPWISFEYFPPKTEVSDCHGSRMFILASKVLTFPLCVVV